MALDKVAVIGSGIAGMHLAQQLRVAGCGVTVFEKSRGTGGRLASARVGESSADLGAPMIESTSHGFDQWLKALGAQRWQPRCVDATGVLQSRPSGWVGVPRNSALTRQLAQGLELVTNARVDVVWPDREGVLLRDTDGVALGHFDAVLVATPASQAQPLLDAVPRFRHWAEWASVSPGWVMLVELANTPVALSEVDWIEAGQRVLARAVCDSHKPGRPAAVSSVWLLEASSEWSARQVDAAPDWVGAQLLTAFASLAGGAVQPVRQRVHRWLYARAAAAPEAPTALWDAQSGIGACGDWLARRPGCSAIEAAWRSGGDLAALILDPVRGGVRVA